VHHNSVLIKIQLDATVFILLQNHSTSFGCPPHPSSGVLKTVTAAFGTGHNISTATSLRRGQVGTGLCEYLPHDSHKSVPTWPCWSEVAVPIL